METFEEYLADEENPQHRQRLKEVLGWVSKQFPELEPVIKWNQPMFTHHGTYIIGFSATKNHMSVAPERVTIERFSDDIDEAGYESTKELIRIPWEMSVDFSLLKKMIEFNIADKAECSKFWRK